MYKESNFEPSLYLSASVEEFIKNLPQHYFRTEILPKIDEDLFSVLFTNEKKSRPKIPVRVVFGALLLKTLYGLSDKELLEELTLNFKYKYAIDVNFKLDFPFSERTVRRFRQRINEYEFATGRDLVHECLDTIWDDIKAYMAKDSRTVKKRRNSFESSLKLLDTKQTIVRKIRDALLFLEKKGVEIPSELLFYIRSQEDVKGTNKIFKQIDIDRAVEDAIATLSVFPKTLRRNSQYKILSQLLNEGSENGDSVSPLQTRFDFIK